MFKYKLFSWMIHLTVVFPLYKYNIILPKIGKIHECLSGSKQRRKQKCKGGGQGPGVKKLFEALAPAPLRFNKL